MCGIGLPLLLASVLQDKVTFEVAGQVATACLFLTCAALYLSSSIEHELQIEPDDRDPGARTGDIIVTRKRVAP